jgi:hypothetical protein
LLFLLEETLLTVLHKPLGLKCGGMRDALCLSADATCSFETDNMYEESALGERVFVLKGWLRFKWKHASSRQRLLPI